MQIFYSRFYWVGILAGGLSLCHQAAASTCPQASYVLNTQTQVEALGSNGCTEVFTDLEVTGTGITSLSSLSNLTSVGGDLEITGSALTTLNGLGGMTSVMGHLSISQNNSLTSVLCGSIPNETKTLLTSITSLGDV